MTSLSLARCVSRSLSRRAVHGVLGALALTAIGLAHAAGPYPNQPIRLIVPFATGGGTDAVARQLALGMSQRLGQQVVVDNRPGAGGSIGIMATVNAAPDGYTLVLGSNGPIAINPALYSNLQYLPQRDLAAVAPAASIPFLMVASPGFKPSTVGELIAAARREPGKLNFASSGTGTTAHLVGELLQSSAKIDMVHVPYKGVAPATNDVAGGQVQTMTGDLSTLMPLVQSGRLKPLAVTGRTRSSLLPKVPTVAESGLPGFEAEGWFGVFAPVKTPPEIVAALGKAIAETVRTPEFKQRVLALGGEVMTQDKAEFDRFIAAEGAKWAGVIKNNKITLEGQ